MQLFSGIFPICYGQFYFFTNKDWNGDLRASFSEQNNGLCGVTNKGSVFFITGLHTGSITLSIDFYETEPEIDFSQDEIVEASFSVGNDAAWLEAWGGELKKELNLPIGDYKIRYYAKDFGLAEEHGDYEEGNIEFYKIDIWPSKIAEDKIIKITSEMAKYWHNELGKQQTEIGRAHV